MPSMNSGDECFQLIHNGIAVESGFRLMRGIIYTITSNTRSEKMWKLAKQ